MAQLRGFLSLKFFIRPPKESLLHSIKNVQDLAKVPGDDLIKLQKQQMYLKSTVL